MEIKNKYSNFSFPKVKYVGEANDVFEFLQKEQLLDNKLWHCLERQFKNKSDDKDRGWRGEFWGKLMRGACLIYRYTENSELYKTLESSVKRMLAISEKNGVITTYKKSPYRSWDMWSRKYVLLGLEYFLDIAKDENLINRVLRALIANADAIMENVNENKIEIGNTSGIWGALNSHSILQPFVKLYKITGDVRYKNYAEYLIKSQDIEGLNFYELAFNDVVPPYKYPIVKAYEMISCFEGLLEYYETTGEEKCLTACVNFANKILDTDYTIVGGTGCRGEYFDNSTLRQVYNDPSIEKQETCVTVTLIKFLSKLFLHTKNSAYQDAVERSLFNLYYGTINFDYKKNKYPIFLSYSPVTVTPRWDIVGGKKNIKRNKFFGCCISIGSAGLGAIPFSTAVFDKNENALYVNGYIPAEYELYNNGDKIAFKVSGRYPDDGNVTLTFNSIPKDTFVKLRKPNWCKNAVLSINGKAFSTDAENGYYILKNVNANDKITFNMDMPFYYSYSKDVNPDVPYRVAISKGPIVFAEDNVKGDLAYDFDFSKEKVNAEYCGNGEYALKLKDGTKLKLKKYSKCGKNSINYSDLNVWFRFNKK